MSKRNWFIAGMIILLAESVFCAESFPKIPHIVKDFYPTEFRTFAEFQSKDVQELKESRGMWSTLHPNMNILALDWTTAASSSLAKYPAKYLFDGRPQTA